MNIRNAAVLAGALVLPLLTGACHGSNTAAQQPVAPQIQLQTNPSGPGFRSPCAGGMPGMQYNCPEARN